MLALEAKNGTCFVHCVVVPAYTQQSSLTTWMPGALQGNALLMTRTALSSCTATSTPQSRRCGRYARATSSASSPPSRSLQTR